MSIKVYPYKMTSESARALAKELSCKRVYPDRKYKYKPGDLVVNWGNSTMPDWAFPHLGILNHPVAVRVASNKLDAFEHMLELDLPVPNFSFDKSDAVTWLGESGDRGRVYCRTKLTGHSGDGIVIATNEEELVDANLYVEGIRGYRDEYRIHVFGDVIDVQMKKRKVDADVNTLIRNHHNGYVYCREDIIQPTEEMKIGAVGAVVAMGLDFGAVDIVKLRDSGEYYILEVNTAPGICNSTLDKYVTAIKEYYNGLT
jgi:glutathione synthase/RimK-type ligase-like ATP-grasp enzyme